MKKHWKKYLTQYEVKEVEKLECMRATEKNELRKIKSWLDLIRNRCMQRRRQMEKRT